MRFFQTSGAQYIDALEVQRVKVEPKKKVRKSFKKAFIAAVTTLIGVTVLASSLNLSALAATAMEPTDPNDGANEASDKLSEIMAGQDLSENGFQNLLAQGQLEGERTGSFASVLARLFTIDYGNEISLASNNGGLNYYCDTNNPANGTLVYHNCDIPNLITEFAQDMVSLLFVSGAYNAEVSSAKMMTPGFGIPVSLIPNGEVPVNRSSGTPKFTALEIYGYSLKYSAYAGEWDHIKVMTKARMLSNFGLMDHLALGGNIVWNSSAALVNNVTNTSLEFSKTLSSGDIIGAFSGFFGGIGRIGEVGLATAVNTIFDTSDYNVVTQNAWYRMNFANTAYGARQLTSNEQSAEALSSLTRLINSNVNRNETATLPEDFPPKTLPAPPLEAVASCEVYRLADNGTWSMEERPTTYIPPGVTAPACESIANSIMANVDFDSSEEGRPTLTEPPKPWFVHDPEGYQTLETLEQWKATHNNVFAGAQKYNIACDLNTDESSRSRNFNNFVSCYNGAWPEAADNTLNDERRQNNDIWQQLVLSSYVMADWFNSNNDANFNAAYNRYVCVHANGNDMKDPHGRFLRVYNADGSPTGNCNIVRPPIQNGLFGNGYVEGQPGQNVAPDTRRELFTPSLLVDLNALSTTLANFSLSFTSFAIKIANTALILSYAPILDSLGIRDIVVSLIESFRDGIFFPLAALLVAFGAVTMLYNFLRSKAFASAIVSVLYMVIAFVLGLLLLTSPDKTMKFVDEAPMMIENTILSAINGGANDDGLCSATGTPGNGSVEGISGIVSDQRNVTRTLTCETWRTFVFTPWVYGQWGTSYDHLYANGYASGYGVSGQANTALSNENTALVGDASVNLGGGVTVKNWALYQLQTQSSGTTTTADTSRPTGVVDKNWYRIVDAQAGPNNGELSDGTFLAAWSGNDFFPRLQVGFLSPVVAAVGAWTIASFSLLKISLGIMTVLLLTVMPLILLIGIQPTFGKRILKSYTFQIVGLMIQRIALTVILAVMMKVVLATSAASVGYFFIALITLVMMAGFLSYRKDILGMIEKSMSSNGAFAGGFAYGGVKALKDKLPMRSVDNAVAMTKVQARGAAAGAAASMFTGGTAKDKFDLIRQSANVSSQRETNKQIKHGLGGFQKTQQIMRAVDSKLEKTIQSEEYSDVRSDWRAAIDPESELYDGIVPEQNEAGENISNTTNSRLTTTGQYQFRDSNGNIVQMRGKRGERAMGSTKQDKIAMRELKKLEDAMFNLETKVIKDSEKAMREAGTAGADYIDKLKDGAQHPILRDPSTKEGAAYLKLEARYEALLAEQAAIADTEFSQAERTADRREHIEALKNAALNMGRMIANPSNVPPTDPNTDQTPPDRNQT